MIIYLVIILGLLVTLFVQRRRIYELTKDRESLEEKNQQSKELVQIYKEQTKERDDLKIELAALQKHHEWTSKSFDELICKCLELDLLNHWAMDQNAQAFFEKSGDDCFYE